MDQATGIQTIHEHFCSGSVDGMQHFVFEARCALESRHDRLVHWMQAFTHANVWRDGGGLYSIASASLSNNRAEEPKAVSPSKPCHA